MNYQFTINDLSTKCNVSKQSIYKLFSKNPDFIKANSIRKNRKVFYNDAVLEYLVSYYEDAPLKVGLMEEPTKEETSYSPADTHKAEDDLNAQEAITALEAKISTLEAKLSAKEEECADLIKQNGSLLLLISQLQTEKQLLLPAPKKSFSEKIKSIFGKKAP